MDIGEFKNNKMYCEADFCEDEIIVFETLSHESILAIAKKQMVGGNILFVG